MLSLLLTLYSLFGLRAALTDEEIEAFRPRNPDYIERNTGLKSVVFVHDNMDGSLNVTTNGVPAHDTWVFPNPESGNPNEMKEAWETFVVFKEPIMRPDNNEIKCLPNGPIGIATSGAFIFGWWAAEKGCPYAIDFEELDICDGHPSPANQYHYHQYSHCVNIEVCGQESKIYGIALDGIPIYGPIDEYGKQLTRADLDVCGGITDSSGRYKYHVTRDPPFFPSCFKGELRKDIGIPEDVFRCGCPFYDNNMPGRGDGPPRDGERPPPRDGERPLPRDGDGPPNCDFSGDINLPANCNDNIDEKAAGDFRRKWKQVPHLVDLIPCCPPGEDCGTSCKADNGTKAACEVELRKLGYMTNVAKKQSCWEACYEKCFERGLCNCKRRCRAGCYRDNGTSDKRFRREIEDGERRIVEKRSCKRNRQRKD